MFFYIFQPRLNVLSQAYGETSELPPDEHRPAEYSFTYSPSQIFKPKAVSTPKPEGWESYCSFQHWSPNIMSYSGRGAVSHTLDSTGRVQSELLEPLIPFSETAHIGEYGWTSSADTDYSAVQSPEQVPPYSGKYHNIFQRTLDMDKAFYVSADPIQQEYDDDNEMALLTWGLAMRKPQQPLDPYYEQCIWASPNLIKNPRILENLRREYAEKKRQVQVDLERQRFEEALQNLPEDEYREIKDLEDRMIAKDTKKLRQILMKLNIKKNQALKDVRVAERLYLKEAQNVKRAIALLENAK